MSTEKTTWSVYGVDENTRQEIKLYSVIKKCTVGEAINEIVKEWKSLKDKENTT